MTAVEKELDELDKLMADVQRTIRENDLFIRHLKEESFDTDRTEEESDRDVTTDDGVYEEL
jgi:hypothetical protein